MTDLRLPFGKYKGDALDTVPITYLIWGASKLQVPFWRTAFAEEYARRGAAGTAHTSRRRQRRKSRVRAHYRKLPTATLGAASPGRSLSPAERDLVVAEMRAAGRL